MIDEYTPYDDIYIPLNATTGYSKLKAAIDILVEELNEADKSVYDTRTARIELERIRRILYRMDHIVMRILKIQAEPWVKIGISKTTYYRRRKSQFDGD